MKAYELISELLTELKKMVSPGVTPLDLDKYAENFIVSNGAKPYNKGYHPEWASKPYPNTLCVSVNNVIAHGIPNNDPFRDGDIVTIDTSLLLDEQCADAALTVGVGNISHADSNLIRFAKKVLYSGIKAIKPGITNWNLAEVMHATTIKYGYSVNVRFIGHGIGREMHEAPKIPCFKLVPGSQDEIHIPKSELKAGQVICLEPMISKSWDRFGVLDKDDQWTCRTADGKNSAMFEHMILITDTGYKVLTTHFDETE